MSEHIEDHKKLYEAARSLRKTGMPLSWPADEVSTVLDELIRLRHIVATGLAVSINQENKELRKDMERINFIEKEWFYAAGKNRYEFAFNDTWDTPGQDLREAIDLAIAKEQQP